MLKITVNLIIDLLITVFGIKITFESNKGDNGKDYIARMTILAFPISIKLILILFLCLAILAYGLEEILNFEEDEWLFSVAGAIADLFFYWRINVHLKYINE